MPNNHYYFYSIHYWKCATPFILTNNRNTTSSLNFQQSLFVPLTSSSVVEKRLNDPKTTLLSGFTKTSAFTCENTT